MNNPSNRATKKTQNRNTSANVNKKTATSKNNRGNNSGVKGKKQKKTKKNKKSNKKTSNNKILSGNTKENLKQVMNTFQDDWIKINQTFEQLNELLKQLAV